MPVVRSVNTTSLLCILLMAFIFFPGCSDAEKEETETMPPHEDISSYEDYMVYVCFSPNSFGDRSYNDLILKGILKAQKEFEFGLFPFSPQSMGEGEEWVRFFLNKASGAKDNKSLYIIAGNEYEACVDSLLNTGRYDLSENKGNNVLLFETLNDSLPIRTFSILSYGAYYTGGAIATLFANRAAVLGGNSQDPVIQSGIEGFITGFMEQGGTDTYIEYLADDYSGYSMPTKAYERASELSGTYRFILPIAGASAQGVYEFSRSYKDIFYTAGIDTDLSTYSANITFSVVKNIDCLIKKYITDWLEQTPKPLHASYGLDSEYIDINTVDKYEASYKQFIRYIKTYAIRKEQKYYEPEK